MTWEQHEYRGEAAAPTAKAAARAPRQRICADPRCAKDIERFHLEELVDGRLQHAAFGEKGPAELRTLVSWSIRHRKAVLDKWLGNVGVGHEADLGVFLRRPVHVEEGWPDLYQAALRALDKPRFKKHEEAMLPGSRLQYRDRRGPDELRKRVCWHRSLAALFDRDNKTGLRLKRYIGPGESGWLSRNHPGVKVIHRREAALAPDFQIEIWLADRPAAVMICGVEELNPVTKQLFLTFGTVARIYTELLSRFDQRSDGYSKREPRRAFAVVFTRGEARFISLSVPSHWVRERPGVDKVWQAEGRLRISPIISLHSHEGRHSFCAALLACQVEHLRRTQSKDALDELSGKRRAPGLRGLGQRFARLLRKSWQLSRFGHDPLDSLLEAPLPALEDWAPGDAPPWDDSCQDQRTLASVLRMELIRTLWTEGTESYLPVVEPFCGPLRSAMRKPCPASEDAEDSTTAELGGDADQEMQSMATSATAGVVPEHHDSTEDNATLGPPSEATSGGEGRAIAFDSCLKD